MKSTSQRKTGVARRLRRDITDAERKLWYCLRARRFSGYKFRRQHPIGPYVADFACVALKLVIELDGGQHGEDSNIDRDMARTELIVGRGFRVLRFCNHEVLQNLDAVASAIENALSERA